MAVLASLQDGLQNLLVFECWYEHGIANADSWTWRGYLVYEAGKSGKALRRSRGDGRHGREWPSNSWWAVKRTELSINASASSMYEQNTQPDDQRGELEVVPHRLRSERAIRN